MRNRLLFALPLLPVLLAAAFWNPPPDTTRYDSARWIESGLAHEAQGDFAAAERDLLQAAEVDHLFQPRWTLAGFYFRRNDPDKFWPQALAALKVGRRDLGALYDLCWKMPGAADKLPSTGNEYLYYLTSTGKWPAAAKTARNIATDAQPGDRAGLLNYCDLALAHDDRAGAFAVWQALRPDPAHLLTNGDFQTRPTGRCFDWRMTTAKPFQKGEADFTLDGFQHEHEVLLEQPLALDPARTYQFSFEYEATAKGLHWQAGRLQNELPKAESWIESHFDFPGTAQSLVFLYQREPGQTISEGTVSIRKAEIKAAQ